MKLIRTSPFNDFDLRNTSFNRFFNDPSCSTRRLQNWSPAVDIVDNKETVLLNVELPGMDKKDIKVNIEDKVLTISGERTKQVEEDNETWYRRERNYGSFKRAFTLSDTIATEEVAADYKAGILTITLKKDTAKEEAKQITVN